MTNRYFYVFFVLSLCVIAPRAWAQNCEAERELIFKLNAPTIGSYNVWDTDFGERAIDERFVDGFFDQSNLLIMAGEQAKKDKEEVTLILAGLGRRGRLMWDVKHDIKGLREVVKILPHGKGFMVLGNRSDDIWIGHFDATGKNKSQNFIKDKGRIQAQDIIKAHDGKNFMLAAQVTPKGRSSHAVFRKITATGKTIFGPAFMMGAQNKINSLSRAGDDYYIGAGEIDTQDGRTAGWIMRLNSAGGIDWQRQHARGSGATLDKVMFAPGRFMVASGSASPSAGHDGTDAGWLMAFSPDSGEIGWQRYYTGENSYNGRDLIIAEDGLISFLIEASASAQDERDYVRLLTINPRGQMFMSDEYFNAQSSDAYSLVAAPSGERIIVGRTDIEYTIENEEAGSALKINSHNGWVVAADGTKPYNDPCIQPFAATP